MSKQCAICGKTPIKAASISFSHKQNTYKQTPNLQTVKIMVDGTPKRVKVCTSCLRAGKVVKVK